MDKVSLEEFVLETLKSISIGVKRAQTASREAGGFPIGLSGVGGVRTDIGEQLVEFSVSVEANRSAQGEGSAGVKATLVSVVSVEAGTQGTRSKSDRMSHTVKFNVPIHFNASWPNVEQ